MANAFGGGNGKGSVPFGTPPGGPGSVPGGGKYGKKKGYCVCITTFKISIKSDSIGTTAQASLASMTFCASASVDDSIITITQNLPGSREEVMKLVKPKNKDICDAFSNIDGLPAPWFNPFLFPDNYVSPDQIQKLMKDLTAETNEVPGNSMGEFMKKLCANPGARGSYTLELTCAKTVGECPDSDCAKADGYVVTLDLPGPINIPYDNLGKRKANIDPCQFSKLLDCWKKNPKANTSFPIGDQGKLVAVLEPIDDPTQDTVDEAAKKSIALLIRLCQKSKK